MPRLFYIGFILLVIGVIAQDYLKPSNQTKKARVESIIASQGLNDIDKYSLTTELSQEADLPNMVDALLKVEVAIDDNELAGSINEDISVKAVPIFDLAEVERKVKTHVVKPGETVKKIAEQYNITVNTLKWANKLKTNQLKVDQKLKILPLDGIIYKVKKGDVLSKIADKYKSDEERIITFNDLELSKIKIGQELIIPEGILPKTERPDYVAPVRSQNFYNYRPQTAYYGPVSSSRAYNITGNPYPPNSFNNRGFYGQCTWWVIENYLRRGDNRLKRKVMGNANEWHYTLPSNGFKKSPVPVAGGIYQTVFGGPYGHVGLVVSVKKDSQGKIVGYTIDEMNHIRPHVRNLRDMTMNGSANFFY